MPSRSSWNGRWGGEENYYAIVRSVPTGKKHTERANTLVGNGPYRYAFGDGWAAQVSVKLIEGAAVTKARKRSKGFCGYDWMVESILRHGEIRT
jgi:hypothetical protein